MARLWQCGFELNSTTTDVELSNVTGAGTSIQTGTVRTGTYALRCNPSAATSFVRYHIHGSNQSTVAYQRAYLRIATAPGGNTTVMRFVDASNNACAQVRLTSSSTLVLLDASGSTVGSASSALSANTWYMLELGLDASTSPGTVTMRLDGSQIATGNNSAQSPWARVLVGPVVSATCDLYFDDWVVNDTSGSAQTSWPGAGKIIHLVPNGDGDNHGWSDTSNSAGTSNNYTLVDEVPPNDTTDLVQTGVANTKDYYTLTDSGIGSGDNVNCVMVGLRLRNNTADATTAVKAGIKKTSGGTISQGSAIVPNSTSFGTNASAQPRNYSLITYADPDGNPWTQSTLDSAQAGIELTTANVNRIQVSTLWVTVDYTPSSGTNASAENASGTGTANNAAPAVSPSAGAPSGTGAANNAAPSVAASAGAASASGTAGNAAPSIAPNAGAATGTGAALDATVTTGTFTNASAGVASGTGTAGDPSVSVAPPAGSAAGVGAAGDGSGAVSASAGTSTGSGSSGSGAAAVAVSAGAAAGAGAGLDATVASSSTSASAGVAAGSGAALDATVTTAVAVAVDQGSWYQLLDILREAEDIARAEASRPPAACPNDGEPLAAGPDGRLFCVFDGWRPDW